MHKYPTLPGIGNQCDAFYPNQPGHEPHLLRCKVEATCRMVICYAGEDQPRAIKRCADCAGVIREKAKKGALEIISDDPIVTRIIK